MLVKVVTDSTADLPPALAEKEGIEVVPISVNFGDRQYKEGVDLEADQFYQLLEESPHIPTTSQPSVGDFLRVYREYSEKGQEILSIHISSKVSGTYNSALQAKKELGDSSAIHLVDSLQGSMGLGLAAMDAVRMAKEGLNCQQIEDELAACLHRFHLFGLLDTLEYLQKGGRIGKAQAFLGSILKIKPILTVRDGEVHPIARVRTREKALNRLVQMVEELSPIESLAVLQSNNPQEAELLTERLGAIFPKERMISARFGPTLGTHLGPGSLGVALKSGR